MLFKSLSQDWVNVDFSRVKMKLNLDNSVGKLMENLN